ESLTQQKAAERAARWVRRQEPHATVYYLGGNGFQYYAERAGLQRVGPGVVLRPGDWLVSDGLFPDLVQGLIHDPRPQQEWRWNDPLPLRTIPFYYSQGAPLGHGEGPRLIVSVYRQPE